MCKQRTTYRPCSLIWAFTVCACPKDMFSLGVACIMDQLHLFVVYRPGTVAYTVQQSPPYGSHFVPSYEWLLTESCTVADMAYGLKKSSDYCDFDIFQKVIFCLALYTEKVNLQIFVMI